MKEISDFSTLRFGRRILLKNGCEWNKAFRTLCGCSALIVVLVELEASLIIVYTMLLVLVLVVVRF
jgi:hypothetical protein